MKHYKLSVPKPCHEDWDTMIPDEVGRFCSRCEKTVIDFTGMADEQVLQIILNSKQKVCGRFNNEQLERIVIQVPQQVFSSQMQFTKMFLMALLVAMGTTLLSCKDENGKSRKIDEVVIVDSLPNGEEEQAVQIDSVREDSVDLPVLRPLHPVGKVELRYKPLQQLTGEVVPVPDTILPPPNVIQVEAPKAIPANPDEKTDR